MMDIIKLALKPLKIIYKKYLKIDSFFKYCICVFRDLFRGRRRNVLSGRFDYLPHQIDQFILGTVFLSLTIFIYPTIFIYKLILGFLYLFSLSINVSMLFLHNILLKIDMFAVIATIFNKNWDFEDCSNFFLTFDFEENYRNSKVYHLELRRSIDYFKILKYLLPSKSDFTNL
ncbi:hypothetical protein MHBO_003994 [Bonamia ostreae]|uniref:Uncharacterized protein n=1 Tax=Bonamia ostreae TaxID=126728 RepID=A0ABV2ASW8_9EUKA